LTQSVNRGVTTRSVGTIKRRVEGKDHRTALDSAEGVGGRLADDLPGTGSRPGGWGLPDPAGCLSLLLLRSRSSASRTPTPYGQKRLRGHATGSDRSQGPTA
jgi:hypothetical protein